MHEYFEYVNVTWKQSTVFMNPYFNKYSRIAEFMFFWAVVKLSWPGALFPLLWWPVGF